MRRKPQAPVEEPADETPEGAEIEQGEDADLDAEGAGELADGADEEEEGGEPSDEDSDASGASEGTEGEPESEPEPDPLQTKAEMWDRLNDQFAADPVALVQSLSKQLPPEKVAALVTLLQQQAAPAPAPACP